MMILQSPFKVWLSAQTELCQIQEKILFPQMELFSMFHLLARVLSHSSSFVPQHYLHYSEKSILKNSVYNGQSWGLLRIAHLMQSSELPTICNPEVGEHKDHIFAKSILSAPFDPNLNVAFTLQCTAAEPSFSSFSPFSSFPCPPLSTLSTFFFRPFPTEHQCTISWKGKKEKNPWRECAMRWMIFYDEEVGGDTDDDDDY